MTTIVASAVPLTRRRRAMIAGVAEGLADHLGWRVGVTRALFLVTIAFGGFGALLYLWLWAFTPLETGDQHIMRRAPFAWMLLGASALAVVFEVRTGPNPYWWGFPYTESVLPPATLAPAAVAVILAVLGGLWASLLDRGDPARGRNHDLLVRSAATVLLLFTAVYMLLSARSGYTTGYVYMALMSLIALLGAATIWASTWIARFGELQKARIQGIRDEQRAEMAAHLHDSVLQTLALIQNRAGASSEVGRIARAQERELRSWLYDADTLPESDLATDLRDYAVSLELDYEVAVTIVSAGTSTERATGEVAAAAREAMLNAARHAGGEVSVYIEGTPGTVDVYIRDRGPGFSLTDVPEDRLGVRESIVGRMRRVGGFAEVRPGAGGGTEVHIRHPAGGSRG